MSKTWRPLSPIVSSSNCRRESRAATDATRVSCQARKLRTRCQAASGQLLSRFLDSWPCGSLSHFTLIMTLYFYNMNADAGAVRPYRDKVWC